MTPFKNIGIIHNSLSEPSLELSKKIINNFSSDKSFWNMNEKDIQKEKERIKESQLMIAVGGDGTILRVAHLVAEYNIPILGINMGRVGFMSEIEELDAIRNLSWYLEGNARLEKRYMLEVKSMKTDEVLAISLNDIAVARGNLIRVAELATFIDGVHLATYRGDGIIVSTATGSTGYNLALGGPVLDPLSKEFILKPIASHMSQFGGVVLSGESRISIEIISDNSINFSSDGFIDKELNKSDHIEIYQSTKYISFLRKKQPSEFWGDLSRKLGIRKGI
ncbi:MAG: NAD(+)/NADH kinase [Dehalococcoidia bacterium]